MSGALSWLADLWSQVYPNLVASAIGTGVLWVKVHRVHRHVKHVHQQIKQQQQENR